MRVGISGTFLDKPMTGSGQYVRNLLRELSGIDDVEMTVFCPSGTAFDEARAMLQDAAHVKAPSLVHVKTPFQGNLGKVWFEQFGLPQSCRAEKVDLLHVPYFGSPLRPPCPTVVTVHDLISMVLPRYRSSIHIWAYVALVSAAARKANVVIADSQYTKGDIVRLLRIPEQRILAVPLACEKRFHPISDVESVEAVRRKYGLPDSFVLYVGGLDWRKNVPTLIQAFAAAESNWQLAIAGEPYGGRGTLFPNLLEVARRCGIERRVKFLGLVAEEDKPALYSVAGLFVFPSVYEGFGLTPLEAMACGAPVLCSNATSLPEVVGDAAVVFDPNDEKGLTAALDSLFSDDARREELRLRGLEQARKFSWRRTAEETLAVYEMALSSNGGGGAGGSARSAA
ncbi:MAG: glycosyltransferase family 1 protein [Chloroflexota bacterium]